MKAAITLATFLILTISGYSKSASADIHPVNVNLLFIAKSILAAVIVFIGISALRSFLRHEKK